MAVSRNLGGKVLVIDDDLSSHEQETYHTTSFDENCIEFDFQTGRNCYVDLRQSYLALNLKFVKGRGYETYNSKEVKKEYEEEAKRVGERPEEVKQAPVFLVTHVNNILHSIFSKVEVYTNNQQNYN